MLLGVVMVCCLLFVGCSLFFDDRGRGSLLLFVVCGLLSVV